MHGRGDALGAEGGAQRLAPARADDEQVVHVVAAGPGGRGQRHARAGEPVAQTRSETAPVVVPAVEPAQLHAQQRGLQGVEPRRGADHAVVVARLLAVRSQEADARFGRSGSAVTTAPPSPQAPRFLVG